MANPIDKQLTALSALHKATADGKLVWSPLLDDDANVFVAETERVVCQIESVDRDGVAPFRLKLGDQARPRMIIEWQPRSVTPAGEEINRLLGELFTFAKAGGDMEIVTDLLEDLGDS